MDQLALVPGRAPLIDRDEALVLENVCRGVFPAAILGIIAGSAVERPEIQRADIDAIVFLPATDKEGHEVRILDLPAGPIEVAAYSVSFVPAACSDDLLFFYYFRELKKISTSHPLFGDSSLLSAMQARVAERRLPTGLLSAILASAEERQSSGTANCLDFFMSTGSTAVVSYFVDHLAGPAKPKWWVADARRCLNVKVSAFLLRFAETVAASTDVAAVTAEVDLLNRENPAPACGAAQSLLADARWWMARADPTCAVYPLLHAIKYLPADLVPGTTLSNISFSSSPQHSALRRLLELPAPPDLAELWFAAHESLVAAVRARASVVAGVRRSDPAPFE